VSRKDSKPSKEPKPAKKVRPSDSHPLLHLLLLGFSCAVSVQGFFPVPGNQVGFLAYVLVIGYFYPLLLRWLRPRTGFLTGLVLLLLILAVAETVGLVSYEAQATGFRFAHGIQDDVLLSPVVLISLAGVVVSAITTYLLGWSMLSICLKVFGRISAPKPVAEPEPEPEVQVAEEPLPVPAEPKQEIGYFKFE
jgi:hypothetical protein